MKNVGIIYHDIYAEHKTGNHPERPERVLHTINLLKELNIYGESRLSHFKEITPRKATLDQIRWCHSDNFITNIDKICQKARSTNKLIPVDGFLGDTIASGASFDASLYASGGNFAAIDAIFEGKIDRAFVLCRPPGHHSNVLDARGFCIFNNIILATQYLIREKGLKKVAIIDFDAHAGNGSEDILNNGNTEGEILFISLHQHPATLYPGTCFLEDIGINKQKGKNVNITFLPNSGQQCVKTSFKNLILPILNEFKPEFILISAGYDGHHDDMITNLGYNEETYSFYIQEIIKIADEYSKGRIQCTLEGGYNLNAIGHSIANTINSLANDKTIYTEENQFEESTKVLEYADNKIVAPLKDILSPYWKSLR